MNIQRKSSNILMTRQMDKHSYLGYTSLISLQPKIVTTFESTNLFLLNVLHLETKEKRETK